MSGYTLITGGAGFLIGANLAHRILSQGKRWCCSTICRADGSMQNVEWLRETHGRRVRLEVADVRDRKALRGVVAAAGEVYHFAAQVAVTSQFLAVLAMTST